MDRERDRDAAEALIEDADATLGNREPDRDRPGQGDGKSRSVDGMTPPDDKTEDTEKKPERHGRI